MARICSRTGVFTRGSLRSPSTKFSTTNTASSTRYSFTAVLQPNATAATGANQVVSAVPMLPNPYTPFTKPCRSFG